jgi:hypothetical protein
LPPENLIYPREWYTSGNCADSEIIRDIIYDLAEHPKSVIDFGCCNGIWLKGFKDIGVKRVLGIDLYVPRDVLVIDQDEYIEHDLNDVPFFVDEEFDLALCLETAEHLKPASSDGLVESLCKASPVVLFSAAVPNQGGSGHINEEWPEFWRDIFHIHGFVVIDCIRDKIWDGPPYKAPPWYCQNTLVFVKETELHKYPKLVAERAIPRGRLSRVWPSLTWLKLPCEV